jgi:MoxR-like ATPase
MRPAELMTALTGLVPTRRPTYIWGPPGVGKSSVVRQVADALSRPVVDVRATLLDPVDLRGLPTVAGGRTTWCPPDFLPHDGEGLLFLDELAQAVPAVQTALLQLTLDRRLGEYVLPDGWTVVAASNRAKDRAGTHRLISPLLNRFVHLDLEVSADDWQDWAVAAGVAPEVRAFLRFRPALLFQFEAAANPRAFPTPRSWSFVSDVLTATPAHLRQRVVAGCVGDGPAAEFVAFLSLYQQLPDVDAVLSNPTAAPVPREPAVLYALVSALVERVRAKAAPVSNFARYGTRLPDEFSVLALRDAVALDRSLVADAAVQRWIADARTKGLFVGA